MRIPISLPASIFLFATLACSSSSGGGGSSQCIDISGTWIRSGALQCSDGSSKPPSTSPVTVAQDGCSVSWTKGGKTHSGTMSGSTLTISEDNTTCTLTFSGDSYVEKCKSTDGDSCTSSGVRTGGAGGSGGSGSGGSGGGACVATGDPCNVNGDCCEFSSGDALCVGYGSVDACGATCTAGAQCQSGCCAALKEGGGACAPKEFCQ